MRPQLTSDFGEEPPFASRNVRLVRPMSSSVQSTVKIDRSAYLSCPKDPEIKG